MHVVRAVLFQALALLFLQLSIFPFLFYSFSRFYSCLHIGISARANRVLELHSPVCVVGSDRTHDLNKANKSPRLEAVP